MSAQFDAALAGRRYRRLLALLPASLRRAYGEEMTADFVDVLAAARADSPSRAALTWLAATLDVLWHAPAEHWRERARRRRDPRRTPKEGTVSAMLHDLRFAVRSLVRSPGASALIALTLALGVAANVAVFTLVDGLFLRPFPFAHADRLVYLNETAPKWKLDFTGINYPDFAYWRAHTHTFDGMALYAGSSVTLSDGATAERVTGALITYDYPGVLGIRPLLGRTFSSEEDRPGAARVVVIGEGLWRNRFAGAPDVVGRVLRVNSAPYTIIGVIPSEAAFADNAQIWLALAENPDAEYQSYSYDGVARLRPGVTVEQARLDLARAHQAIWLRSDTGHNVSPRVMPLRDRYVAEYRAMGGAMSASVAFVLLIACANVASVMLARAIFRQRELGIRVALGASGARLVRLLLTESLTLATAAGMAGTVLGVAGLRLLLASVPDTFPPWARFDLDVRIALFALAVTAGTAMLFGGIPALQAMRQDVRSVIGGAGARASASVPQRRLLGALVVFEVALATVLLVGSGLLLRTYANLRTLDPGFRADHVLSFRLWLPPSRYEDGLAQRAVYEELIARLRTIPGVRSAGGVTCPPLSCHWGRFLEGEGMTRPSDGSDPVTLMRLASPDYLDAMGIRLVKGRQFTNTDFREGGFRAVIVNEEFADRMWPGVSDPTGRRIHPRGDTLQWDVVVGVVKDARHYGLTTPMRPGVYYPLAAMRKDFTINSLAFVLHTSVEPTSVLAAARAVVRQRDPELPLSQVGTMSAALDRSLAVSRALMLTLVVFAGVALMLAVAGIYGVLSYMVGRRSQEIGIRMALGARGTQVLALIVRQGLVLVALGLGAGVPAALGATRALDSLLTGVSPHDPLTYAVVALLLTLTGAAATVVPARRAAGTDLRRAMGDGG